MHKILRALVLTITLLTLAQSACTPQKAPIRIAISPRAGIEPLEIAEQLGYFKKYGVEVKIVRFSVYCDSIEALIDGKVDAGMHTLDDAIRYFSAGKDVRVVLLTDYSFGNDGLVARPGIETLADLRSARIGVEAESSGYFSLLKILDMGKLTMNDVTIVSIPTWEIKQFLLDGKIDAGVIWEPYLSDAAKVTGGKILITSRDYPETIISTMTFDAAIVEQNPQDVQKIAAAYFDALGYIKAYPQDAYQRLGQTERMSLAEFESHVTGNNYLNLTANMELFGINGKGRIYEQANSITQYLFEHDVIASMPDINQLLLPFLYEN